MSGTNGSRAQTTDPVEITITHDLTLGGHELAPADISRLVTALLIGIQRGELEASPREIEFLSSIGEMLASGAA